MANEQSVDLLIRAREITSAAFASVNKQLTDLETGVGGTTTKLKGLGQAVDQWNGTRLFTEANAAAQGIASVGGASKLTQSELERASRTITDAVDKYRALGQDPPAAVAKLDAELKQLKGSTASFASTLGGDFKTQFLGTLAGFVSAQAIIGAASGAFNLAVGAIVSVKDAVVDTVTNTANLGDLLLTTSKKFDVSVERASMWRYIADQAGTSLDAMMGSVGKLQTAIGTGGEKVEKSLTALGTSLSAIRSMRPDEAFEQILVKLQDIPRESDRAAIGVGLFGKGFREVAQLTREDIGEMMERFGDLGGKITTEMAVSGDAFNDAKGDWNLLVERIETSIGGALLPAATAFTNIMVNAVQKTLNESGVSATQFEAEVTSAFANVVDIMAMTVKATGFLVQSFLDLWAGPHIQQGTALVTLLGLIGAQTAKIGAVQAAILNQGSLSKFFGEMAVQFADISLSAQKIGAAGAQGIETFDRLAESIGKIGDEMKGKGASAIEEVRRQIAESAAEMRKGQENTAAGAALIGAAAKGPVADLAKSLAELTTKIVTAQASGTSFTEIVRLFGAQSLKTADEAKALGLSVKQSVEDIAFGQSVSLWNAYFDKVLGMWRGFATQTQALADKWEDDILNAALKSGDARAKALQNNLSIMTAAERAAADTIAKIGETKLATEIRHIREAGEVQKRQVDVTVGLSKEALAAIQKQTDAAVASLTKVAVAQLKAEQAAREHEQSLVKLGMGLDIVSGFLRQVAGDSTLAALAVEGLGVVFEEANIASARSAAEVATVASEAASAVFDFADAQAQAAVATDENTKAQDAQSAAISGGIGLVFAIAAADMARTAAADAAAGKIREGLQDITDDLRDQFGSLTAANAAAERYGLTLGDIQTKYFRAMGGATVSTGPSRGSDAADADRYTDSATKLLDIMEQLASAVEKYGLALTDMPNQKDRLDAATFAARELFQTLDLLVRSGYDVSKVVDVMSDDINAWLEQMVDAGVAVPVQMQAVIDSLIKTGQITDENAMKMLGFVGDAVPSIDEIRAAAERYGFTWEQVEAILERTRIATQAAADAKLLEDVTAAAERYGIALKDMGEAFQAGSMRTAIDALLKDFALLTSSGVSPDATIRGMSKALNQLIIDAVSTGSQLPETMRPMIEQMIRMGLVTEDAARAMLGLGTDTTPTLADVTAAAERYGLKLDDLGSKVQQLRITEAGKQIATDFATLTAAGVPFDTLMKDIITTVTDTGENFSTMSEKAQAAYLEAGGTLTNVTSGMRSEIQDLVSRSLAMGLELPASMQPFIATMVEGGLLTNGMGEKLRDLSGLTFATDLNKMFESLMLKLDSLIGKISGDKGVGGALDKLPGAAGDADDAMTDAGQSGEKAFKGTEVAAKNTADSIKGCWDRSGEFKELLAGADFADPFDTGRASVDLMRRAVEELSSSIGRIPGMPSGASGASGGQPISASDFRSGSPFSQAAARVSAARGGSPIVVQANMMVGRQQFGRLAFELTAEQLRASGVL